jgi:hypothetical protein
VKPKTRHLVSPHSLMGVGLRSITDGRAGQDLANVTGRTWKHRLRPAQLLTLSRRQAEAARLLAVRRRDWPPSPRGRAVFLAPATCDAPFHQNPVFPAHRRRSGFRHPQGTARAGRTAPRIRAATIAEVTRGLRTGPPSWSHAPGCFPMPAWPAVSLPPRRSSQYLPPAV